MYTRLDKINELIREKLSKIIYDQSPDSFISISSVDISSDFSFCDVSVMVIFDRASAVEALNHRAHKIQKIVARDLNLRQTPVFRFHLDRSEAYAENIDRILSEGKK